MIEFLFGNGRRPTLSLDLARVVFGFIVLLTMNVLWWHLPSSAAVIFSAMYLVTTLVQHYYWRSHPEEPHQVTRYNSDYQNKV
jgi:hypothetical protein